MIRSARGYAGAQIVRIWINTNFDNALNPENKNLPLAELPDVRRTPSDAEVRNFPGPGNVPLPPRPTHDENRRNLRSVSTNVDKLMFPFGNSEGVKDPPFDTTPVPLSSVGCMRDPTNSDRAYFCRNRYTVINVKPGTMDNTVSWGPKAIVNIWPSFWVAEVNRHAFINFAPGTTNDCIINGPKKIEDNWSSLKAAKFAHIDAVVPNPVNKDEAYFFSGGEYVLIIIKPGTTGDFIIVQGPHPFLNYWPSLKKAKFSRIDANLPNPANKYKAYFFYGSEYTLIYIKPGTTNYTS